MLYLGDTETGLILEGVVTTSNHPSVGISEIFKCIISQSPPNLFNINKNKQLMKIYITIQRYLIKHSPLQYYSFHLVLSAHSLFVSSPVSDVCIGSRNLHRF